MTQQIIPAPSRGRWRRLEHRFINAAMEPVRFVGDLHRNAEALMHYSGNSLNAWCMEARLMASTAAGGETSFSSWK